MPRGPDELTHTGDAQPWLRQGPYYWTGPGGCQVAACRLGPAARWRFSAWGAEAMPGLTVWQWQDAIKPPVRYAIGEAVARRRPWLGVYDTAEAARAACLAWLAGAEAGQAEAEAGQAGAEAGQAGPGGDAADGGDLASGGQADGRLGALGAAGGSEAGVTMAMDSSLWLDATGGGAVEPTTEG